MHKSIPEVPREGGALDFSESATGIVQEILRADSKELKYLFLGRVLLSFHTVPSIAPKTGNAFCGLRDMAIDSEMTMSNQTNSIFSNNLTLIQGTVTLKHEVLQGSNWLRELAGYSCYSGPNALG